jgi:hypothetical protein
VYYYAYSKVMLQVNTDEDIQNNIKYVVDDIELSDSDDEVERKSKKVSA